MGRKDQKLGVGWEEWERVSRTGGKKDLEEGWEGGGQLAESPTSAAQFAQVHCATVCCKTWGLAEVREAQNPDQPWLHM